MNDATAWIGKLLMERNVGGNIRKLIDDATNNHRKYLFSDHIEEKYTFQDWWSLLKKSIGTERESINIKDLRAKLARVPPHINLCYSELGMKGAILGTIEGYNFET